MSQDVHLKGTMILKSSTENCLIKIKLVKPNCGLFCLLLDEKLDQNKNEIISPNKEHRLTQRDF